MKFLEYLEQNLTYSIRRNLLDYILDIFKIITFEKNVKKILVYNVSLANIILSIIARFKSMTHIISFTRS